MENFLKEELIEELITIHGISTKLSESSNQFVDFLRGFEVLSSDLAIMKNYKRVLTEGDY